MIPLLEVGLGIIDKLIPDRDAREKAKLELLRLQQEGSLKESEIKLSAIIAEASSADRWTSRARPSFLYVIYIMILSSIPMGVFYLLDAGSAQKMVEGVKFWLDSIPEPMWALFGAGYLGYTGARSYEKRRK